MTTYPCRVVRTRRRTLTLEVTRTLEVIVRAPLRISDAEIARFTAAHQDWIARAIARQRDRQARHPEPTEAEAAALRRRAQEVLPGKVAAYARRMGVVPTAIHITSARTRFGSCSGKNSLSF